MVNRSEVLKQVVYLFIKENGDLESSLTSFSLVVRRVLVLCPITFAVVAPHYDDLFGKSLALSSADGTTKIFRLTHNLACYLINGLAVLCEKLRSVSNRLG